MLCCALRPHRLHLRLRRCLHLLACSLREPMRPNSVKGPPRRHRARPVRRLLRRRRRRLDPPPPPRSPTAVTTRSTPAAWAGLLSLTSCSAENRRVQISRRTSNAARRCPRPSQSISRSPTRASRSGRGGRRTLPARSTWLSTSARSR